MAPHLRATVLITNCSNNYGPYHFPEKMIPLMILNAMEGKTAGLRHRHQKFVTGFMWRTTRER